MLVRLVGPGVPVAPRVHAHLAGRRPVPGRVELRVVAGPDFETQIKQLQATMHTIEQVLDLGAIRTEIADLGEQVAAPDLWDDQANAQRATGRLSVHQADL